MLRKQQRKVLHSKGRTSREVTQLNVTIFDNRITLRVVDSSRNGMGGGGWRGGC